LGSITANPKEWAVFLLKTGNTEIIEELGEDHEGDVFCKVLMRIREDIRVLDETKKANEAAKKQPATKRAPAK
jgi:hypothetical protein